MRLRRARLGLAALLGIGAGLALAQDMRETERRLQQVRGELQQIGQERRRLEGARNAAARALREADERVGQSSRQLADTQAALTRQEAEVTELHTRRGQLQQQLSGQRERLARLLRASYQNGQQAALKVLLSQDQIRKGQRDLAYYTLLQRQRSAQIRRIGTQLAELDAVEVALAEKQLQLATTRQQQQRQLQEVAAQRQARSEALAKLEGDYRSQAQREQALGRDAQALERLLGQLRDAAARAERERLARERREAALRAERARREAATRPPAQDPPATSRRQPATRPARSRPATATATTAAPASAPTARPAAAVGGAGWPLNGQLLAGFGGTFPEGGHSNGLLIAAAAGTPVRAVADGQVVFAEWMSGYGLLCIVDHGNGYMSLYAHNDALMKAVGSQVRRGDTLASVGTSGGRSQPALYFELRQGGRPVNPARWLRR